MRIIDESNFLNDKNLRKHALKHIKEYYYDPRFKKIFDKYKDENGELDFSYTENGNKERVYDNLPPHLIEEFEDLYSKIAHELSLQTVAPSDSTTARYVGFIGKSIRDDIADEVCVKYDTHTNDYLVYDINNINTLAMYKKDRHYYDKRRTSKRFYSREFPNAKEMNKDDIKSAINQMPTEQSLAWRNKQQLKKLKDDRKMSYFYNNDDE